MKKKVLILIALILVCLLAFSACSQTISYDGGFENYDEKTNKLKDWKEYKFEADNEDKNPTYELKYPIIDPNTVEGNTLVTNRYIEVNVSDNYGVYRLSKQVSLKKGLTYKLSYSINIPSDMSGSNSRDYVGAFVGILEAKDQKEFRTNSKTGGWVKKELYITVEANDSYTLAVGIGMEDKGARGKMMLDNVALEQVERAPSGTTVVSIGNSKGSSGIVGGTTYTVLLAILSIFVCYAAYFMIRKLKYKQMVTANFDDDDDDSNNGGAKKRKGETKQAPISDVGETAVAVAKVKTSVKVKQMLTSNYAIFSYILLVVFFLRFIIMSFMDGMADQLEDFAKVALAIPDVGLGGIYEETSLPINFGFMYILAALGGIGNLAELAYDSTGMMMLIRLPFMLGDLISIFLIYSFIGKHVGYKQAAVVAGLFGVLPMIFTASSAWGMLLSITLPMIIGTVILMVNKRMISAIAVFTLSMTMNTLMIVMLPVMITYGVYYSVVVGFMAKRDAKKKDIVMTPSDDNKFKAFLIDNKVGIGATVATILSIVLFWALSLPFTYNYVLKGDIFFIFNKAAAAVFTNPLVTNSVFNIYSMLGMGGATAQTSSIAISSIIMVALIGAGVYAWLKSYQKNRLDFILITAFAFIGYSMFGVGVKFEMVVTGIVLLLIYAMMRNDKRIFNIFSIYSLLYFINMGMIMIVSKVFGTDPMYLNLAYNNWLYIVLSVFALLNTIYLFKVMYDIMLTDYNVEIMPLEGNMLDAAQETAKSISTKFNTVFKK